MSRQRGKATRCIFDSAMVWGGLHPAALPRKAAPMLWFALLLLLATFALAEFRERLPLEPLLARRAIAGGFAASGFVFLIAALLEVSFLGFALCLAAGLLALAENRRRLALDPALNQRALPLILAGAGAVLLIALVVTLDLGAALAGIGAALAEMDRRQAGLNTIALAALGFVMLMFGAARGADRAAMAGYRIAASAMAGPAALAGVGLLLMVWAFTRI